MSDKLQEVAGVLYPGLFPDDALRLHRGQIQRTAAYAERQARGRAAEELFVLASRLVAQDVEDMAVYDEIRALRDALAET